MIPAPSFILALLGTLVATSATAQTLNGVLPPVEYDHSFAGELTVFTAKDEAEVRALCYGTKFPPIGALGCALHLGKYCTVVLAPDADIVAAGHTTEVVKRHEIGHCNGWSAAHAGARPFEEWGAPDNTATPTVPPRVMDAASQFDAFARWAVGKTVGEIAITWSNKLASAQFLKAAKGIGLTPESRLTGQVLSNQAKAMPLARVRGIGTDLSDEEWRRAHAIAFYAAKARQAAEDASVSRPGQ
jgi:hypothetical protein